MLCSIQPLPYLTPKTSTLTAFPSPKYQINHQIQLPTSSSSLSPSQMSIPTSLSSQCADSSSPDVQPMDGARSRFEWCLQPLVQSNTPQELDGILASSRMDRHNCQKVDVIM